MCKVSIIIPSYNRAHILHKTIPTYVQEHVCEIIIVDDNSSDRTEEVVKEIKKTIPIVKYYKSPIKILQTGAKNKGIEMATGDYCYFGDDDSVLKPDTIASLLRVCQDNPKSIVGARHLYLKPEDNIQERLEDKEVHEFKGLDDFIDRKHIKVDTYKKYNRVLKVPFVQSCFMLPTEVAKKQKYYGGYVGTCNREETDYQMQVCLNYGYNILLDNESLSLDLPRTLSSGGIRSVKNYKRHFLEIYNEYQFWKRNKEYLKEITNENPAPILRALAFMFSKIIK
jgi:glycosyltransferase involved in cell wall biosynthesis